MFTGISATSSFSFKEKIAGWRPSFYSLPGIPSREYFKGAFHSLNSCFRSRTTPLSTKDCEELTELSLPLGMQKESSVKNRCNCAMSALAVVSKKTFAALEYCKPSLGSCFRSRATPWSAIDDEDMTELEIQKKSPIEYSRRREIYALAMMTTCFATYVFIKFCQPQLSQSSDEESANQSSGLAIAGMITGPLTQYANKTLETVVGASLSALSLSLANAQQNEKLLEMEDFSEVPQELGFVGRNLLSEPSSLDYEEGDCHIVGTEEIPLSTTMKVWKMFSSQFGRLLVLNETEFFPDLNFIQHSFSIINKYGMRNAGAFVIKDFVMYLGNTQEGVLSVLDLRDPLHITLRFILNTGISDPKMVIVGDELILAGNQTIARRYDISNRFNPIFKDEITNSTLKGNGIAGSETNLVTTTDRGFYSITNSSQEVLPGVVGTLVATSPDADFVRTSVGVYRISKPPGIAVTGFLPMTSVLSLLYTKSGFLLVGTIDKQHILDVNSPNMTIVYSSPSGEGAASFEENFEENRIYYTAATGSGMGIMSIGNVSETQYLVKNLFPEIGGLGKLASFGNNYIALKQGDAVYILTAEETVDVNGISPGGSQGNHSVTYKAIRLDGRVIDQRFVCNLTILAVIKVVRASLEKIIGAVNQPMQGFFPLDTFKHDLGLPLTLTLECQRIQNIVSVNPNSGQYIGTPQQADVGLDMCRVRAKDGFSATAVSPDFELEIVNGIDLRSIPNQPGFINEPYFLNLNDFFSSKDSGSTFTFAVSGLPASFVVENGAISGTPLFEELGPHTISVIATLLNGISKTQSFTFNIMQLGVAVTARPLSTYTLTLGDPFVIQIPPDYASNPNNLNANITYFIRPPFKWMFYDKTLNQLRGTPPRDAKKFDNVIKPINVVITQTSPGGRQAVTTSSFNVVITGESTAQFATATAGTLFGIFTFGVARREAVFNRGVKVCHRFTMGFFLCKYKGAKFPKVEEQFFPQQSLEYTFEHPTQDIAGYKILHNGKLFGNQLPNWIEEDIVEGKRRIKAEYVPKWVESMTFIPYTRKIWANLDLGMYTFHKSDLYSHPHTFSRSLKTLSRQIKAVQIFRGENLKPEKKYPTNLIYDKNLNSIVAKNIGIQPLTVVVRGIEGKTLEMIHINKRPYTQLLEESDYLEINEAPSPSSPSRTQPSDIELALLKNGHEIKSDESEND